MLTSRSRCAFAGGIFALSLLLASAHQAVAQSAKSAAAGQTCGCSKNSKSVVQPGFKANQQFTSSAAKHHHHQQAQTTAGLNPGQTTPWMMGNQPTAMPSYAVPTQFTPQAYLVRQPMQANLNQNNVAPGQVPMSGQPVYLITQPMQQGLNQPLANANYAAAGQMPLNGQPVYLIAQPGFNQNANYQPGQMAPFSAQPAYLIQSAPTGMPGYGVPNAAGTVGMPGYGVPNQNLANNATRFQPTPTSTAWALTPAANGGMPGLQSATCNCNKQTGSTPSQAHKNANLAAAQTGRQPATNVAAVGQHTCPPQQMQQHTAQHAAHAKKK